MFDGFEPYIEERPKAGVWNAQVLVRELPEGNAGGTVAQTEPIHQSRCYNAPVCQSPTLRRLS